MKTIPDAHRIISTLREHRADLEAKGVSHLALFGSVARGDTGESSDVDVAVSFAPERRQRGLAFFGQIDELRMEIEALIGCGVDIVAEPVLKDDLRISLARDRVDAF